MGEYAQHNGRIIKIGTCEDLYYLRADQADHVVPESGSLDPADEDVQKVIRFRFPWPDEDGTPPGGFEKFNRELGLYGVELPDELDHGTLQFTAPGFNVCLPCPESKAGKDLPHTIHRNGYAGPVRIVQQAYRNGNLALICRCGGCGRAYNLPTIEDAQPILDKLGEMAKRRDPERDDGRGGDYLREIAARIRNGYSPQPVTA